MERNDAQEKYTVHKVSHIMGLVKVQKTLYNISRSIKSPVAKWLKHNFCKAHNNKINLSI